MIEDDRRLELAGSIWAIVSPFSPIVWAIAFPILVLFGAVKLGTRPNVPRRSTCDRV